MTLFGGSRIQMLKMLGAVRGLFSVSFYPYCVTLKIKSGWKKVSSFSKEVKMLEV